MKKIFFTLLTVLLTGLAAQAATKYQINVGGVEVTSDNASYITGGDIEEGYATYSASDNTLTLHSIIISRNSGDGNYAIHNRDCAGLRIKCEGTCKLTTATAHTIHMDKMTRIWVTSGSYLYVKMTGASSSNTAALYSKNNSDIYIWGPGRLFIETTGSSGNYPRAIMADGSRPNLYFSDLAGCDIKSAGYSIYNYNVTASSAGMNGVSIDMQTKNASLNVFYNVGSLNIYSDAVSVYPADYELTNGYLYDEDGAFMDELQIANPSKCLPINAENFPNYNFRHWLRDNLPLNYYGWGYQALSLEHLDKIKEIDCHGQSISSLQGIGKFTYLETLKCYNNSISSLDLSSNTSLTYLSCYGNGMTSLNVNSCTNLTYLDCAPNSLTSLNVSSLSKLQTLYCYSNNLTSLSLPSSSSSSLQKLYCYNNRFTTLSVTNHPNLTILDAKNNTSMTSFNCYANKLSSLNVTGCSALQTLKCYGSNNTFTTLDLTGTTALTYLDCGPCPYLSSITNLSSCTGMKTLICYTNNLSDLSAVNSLSNLESLDCHNTKISSLTLTNKSKLTSVSAYNNPSLTSANIYSNNALTSLSIYSCPALTTLKCNTNNLTTLNVTSNTALNSLTCYHNYNLATITGLANCTAITNLDVEHCALTDLSACNSMTNLTYLDCRSNKISSLMLTNKTKLATIYANENPSLTTANIYNNSLLEELYLTNCPALTTLNCYSNNLGSLNLEGNTGLTSLDCRANQLTSLDVSALTNLQELWCNTNQLTTLNVNNNTKLQYLYCYNNKLTSLNVSSKTTLNKLQCQNNQLTSLNVQGCSAMSVLNCSTNKLSSLYVQGCTALNTLYSYQNQITAAGMTTLVNSLPTRSSSNPGTLRALYNTSEGNVFNASHLSTAQAKYWNPKKYNGSNWVDITFSQHGDVDGNGVIGMDDLTALINYLVYGTTSGIDMTGADVDGNGVIGMDDLTALINYLVYGHF